MPRLSFPVRTTLSVLCAVIAVSGCSRQDDQRGSAGPAVQKQPVEVTTISRGDLAETLSVVGSIAPNESTEIRPEISGQVKQIFFEEGLPVKQGQVLLKIDDAELRAQYAQTEARYKLAQLNLERNQSLVESKMVSQADFDRVHAEYAASAAELSLLKVRLDKSEIKAPFDGIAGSRTISPGDYVTTQSVVTVINDLSRLKLDFQVPERFLTKVKPGTRFSLRAKMLGTDTKVEGDVYFVSSIIDRATRSSEVKGLLKQPPELLKPGMFANVEIILEVRGNVLIVPEGAILTTASGPQLIVVKTVGSDRVAEFVSIELGLRAKGVVEVQSAKNELSENLPIVGSGVGSLVLFPGAKLEPRPLRKEFQLGGEGT